MPASTIWMVVFLLINPLLLLGLFIYFNSTNGLIRSAGRRRRFLLYVPKSYQPDRPAPLVFSYHGLVQWPAHQGRLSGWNKLAEQHGFVVVYPRGSGFPLRWNAYPSARHPGRAEMDLAFFSDLLDHLCQSYNIDRSRVYVNGMSNGAGMSHLLACRFGDRIAAVGGVAGAYLYPRERVEPCPRVPVIAFHGSEDPIVPYQGGSARRHGRYTQFPEIEAWAADWAAHNGCAGTPDLAEITPQISRISYPDCQDGCDVVLYKIRNGGHTWPGGKRLPVWLTGKTNREIKASEIMWDFFQEHPLR